MDIASSLNTLSLHSQMNSFAAVICGNHTEFVITSFPNYLNIIVTQFGKVGNLYRIQVDEPENGYSITEPIYTIRTILGSDNLEAEVAVRYLTGKLKISGTLLLCLSLKDYSRTTLNAVINAIESRRI